MFVYQAAWLLYRLVNCLKHNPHLGGSSHLVSLSRLVHPSWIRGLTLLIPLDEPGIFHLHPVFVGSSAPRCLVILQGFPISHEYPLFIGNKQTIE